MGSGLGSLLTAARFFNLGALSCRAGPFVPADSQMTNALKQGGLCPRRASSWPSFLFLSPGPSLGEAVVPTGHQPAVFPGDPFVVTGRPPLVGVAWRACCWVCCCGGGGTHVLGVEEAHAPLPPPPCATHITLAALQRDLGVVQAPGEQAVATADGASARPCTAGLSSQTATVFTMGSPRKHLVFAAKPAECGRCLQPTPRLRATSKRLIESAPVSGAGPARPRWRLTPCSCA